MIATINELLKEHYPFLHEKELLEEICKEGIIKYVNEGDVLLNIGSYIKSMPLIIKGSFKIIREDEKGNELLMYYIKPGETCAMSMTCCLKDAKSKVRAVAEEETEMILLPVRFMDEWMMKYRSWKNFVIDTYQSRFEELLTTIDSIAFLKMDERLEKYLLKKSEKQGKKVLNITHQEIATDFNSSREVISRLLKQLEKKEIIKLSRNKIKILS